MKPTLQALRLSIALATCGLLTQAGADDYQVLIIGSTHSYSEGGESGVVHQAPFNPTAIETNLESILNGDPAVTGTVNVVFEDLYRNKSVTTAIGGSGTPYDLLYHCYSLSQYFLWPDGKDARLSNLRGGEGTDWDYIILVEDPYVLKNFPGMYAEAVRLYHEEISKGGAELVLMSQWSSSGPTFDALDFNGLAFRAGDSLGLRVAPAALAWHQLDPKDGPGTHPTTKGAYLAAASIYSTLTTRNASTSSYNPFPAEAQVAFDAVGDSTSTAQYTGIYSTPNKFQMRYDQKRQIDFNENGTSTEEGFFRGLRDAIEATNMNYSRRNPPSSGNPVDFTFSRGNDIFEANKQYQVDPDRFKRTYGLPMGDHSNTGATSMKYGIDKRYYFSSHWDGTDLGIAYDMLLEGEVEPLDVRGIPARLLWSKMSHYQPQVSSHRDGWHLSNELDRAAGAFMFTLSTGRCPIDDEPADTNSSAWKNWFGRKIGYETAWQMSHMTARVPGFRVVPPNNNAGEVSPGADQTLAVSFLYPPEADVTVSLAVNDPTVGSVSSPSLTFTPTNFDTPQQVTVSGLAGTTGTFPFHVTLTTSSPDVVFDGLSDQWEFDNTRIEPAGITVSKTTATVAENGGTDTFTVVLDHPPGSDVVLDLSSSDSAEMTVSPASLTFTTGNWDTAQTVTVTGVDDSLYQNDSTSAVVSVNQAASYASYDVVPDQSVTVNCTDDELGVLVVNAGAGSISENGGSSNASVTRTGSTAGALVVTLVSDDTTEASVPSSVTILDGQPAASFTISGVDDGDQDGNQTVTISATAAAHVGGSDSLEVTDDDNAAPSFSANPILGAGATEDVAYGGTLAGSATDPEDHPLTYAKVSGPAWLSVASNGTLSGTPVNADTGANAFVVSVSDGIAPPVTAALNITVVNVNDAPVFVSDPVVGAAVVEDQSYSGSLAGSATDEDGDAITYAKVSGPAWLSVASDGALSGTPADTDIGTNSFIISASDAIAPPVEAALQIQVNAFVPFIAGLRFGSVAGNLNDTDDNPGTDLDIITDVASKTEDSIASNTTEIFTGQIYDADGSISFTEHIDDKARIWIDGVLVVTDDNWRNRTISANLNLTPGWHDIEIRISNGTGGSGPNVSPGIGFDPNGGTTWQTLVDPGDGSLLRVSNVTNTPPTVDAGPPQTVTISTSSPWSPAVLSPQAWYDASNASTLTVTDGAVSEWRDQSTHARHATQTTAAARPTTGSNTMSGLDVITFDGSSEFLNLDLDYLAGVSHSAFIVTRTTTYTDIYGAATSNSGSRSLHVGFASATRYRMNYWANDWQGTVSGNFDAAGGNLLNFVWTSGSTKQIFANGHSEGSVTGAGVIGTMAGGGRLGQVVNHGHYGGDIGEILFLTGTVSDSDRENMEGYLAHKWGLAGGLDANHPYKAAAPGGSSVVVSLAGTADDADGDPLTTGWSLFDGPAAVSFADPAALNTSVTFTAAGTYTLRLTADDGSGSVLDDVEITIVEPTLYDTWTEGSFAQPFTDTAWSANPDGDQLINLQEFAFGMDPTMPTQGSLDFIDGGALTRSGMPALRDDGGAYLAVFTRHKDHANAGLTYRVQFSADLEAWTATTTPPTVRTSAADPGDYEAVSVPFLSTVPVAVGGPEQAPSFFRVEVVND